MPPQHTAPPPQSAFSEQSVHSPSRQGLPPHSEVDGELQQAPVMHAPPQHFCPLPQSPSPAHVEHVPDLHDWPSGQLELSQQLPAVHLPAQHSEPSPHSLLVRQLRHPSAPHTCPGRQVETSHLGEVPASGVVVVLVHDPRVSTRGNSHCQRLRIMRPSGDAHDR